MGGKGGRGGSKVSDASALNSQQQKQQKQKQKQKTKTKTKTKTIRPKNYTECERKTRGNNSRIQTRSRTRAGWKQSRRSCMALGRRLTGFSLGNLVVQGGNLANTPSTSLVTGNCGAESWMLARHYIIRGASNRHGDISRLF